MKNEKVNSTAAVFDALEELLERMSKAYPDLKAVLLQGLGVILAYTKRPYAAIVLPGLEKLGYLCVISENAPSEWNMIAENPDHFIKLLKLPDLISRQLKTITKSPLGPLTVISLLAGGENQSVLLLEGKVTSSYERLFLQRAGKVIESILSIQDNTLIFMDRSNLLDAELGKILTSFDISLEISEVQLKIAKIIRDTFKCHAVVMAFLDIDGLLLKKTLSNDSNNWLYQVSLKPGQGLIGESIAMRKPILIEDASQYPAYNETIDGIPDQNIKSLLCVPLGVEGQLLGAIELVSFSDNKFTMVDQQLLSSVSSTMASVLYNIQLVYQLKVLNAELEANTWELTRSRNTLRSLFDNMPFSVYIIDKDYRLNAVNMARANRVQKDPRELPGIFCYTALYGLGEACAECMVSRTLAGRKVTNRKRRLHDESDELIEWDINSYPIISDSGEVVQAILFEQDVTEKRRLEAILAQSEKLAAIGQLAAGLAHEINNPLTVIMANTQILQRELPKNDDWGESLELIMRAGTRALQVVRNLLSFARKEEYQLVPVDINENILRAIEMIRHETMARSVTLIFEPGENNPPVMASADHLQGVWLNIMLNALDAIEDNSDGIIRIATFVIRDELQTTITDNGLGISPERLKRIFEPFYTTKEPGRKTGGTGLGLSVSHRIIKQHGGDIYMESTLKKGTTFTVALPVGEKYYK